MNGCSLVFSRPAYSKSHLSPFTAATEKGGTLSRRDAPLAFWVLEISLIITSLILYIKIGQEGLLPGSRLLRPIYATELAALKSLKCLPSALIMNSFPRRYRPVYTSLSHLDGSQNFLPLNISSPPLPILSCLERHFRVILIRGFVLGNEKS